MPWRAGQEGKGSEATGSGRTRLWHESCPDTRSGTTPTGGARLSVAAGGEGRDGLGRRKRKSNGPAMGEFGPREKKKKKGRGRWAGPAGLKTRGGKRKDFAFLKLNQTIQFKLKFREFKFEPNNKQ